MPIGTWAPPTPEYLTAPGYETYAPTRAYGYSPTGGDWSGAYPGYGGGGGGGLTSGDFGGGTDNSTLGGLLSAASLLGGANDLSSLLTGKGLLEHAGIPNPFSGLLGSEGARGIIGNTPWSQIQNLFGAGPIAQNAALTQALHPTGDIGLIEGLPFDPSGGMAPPGGIQPRPPGFTSVAPESFWGDSAASQAFRNANNIYPSYGASTELGTAALTDAQGAALAEALGGSPLGAPAAQPAPLNLNVPDPFNPVTGEYASAGDLWPTDHPLDYFQPPQRLASPSLPPSTTPPGAIPMTPRGFESQFQGTPTAGPYGANPAFTEAALNTLVPGYSTTLGAAATAAGMSPGLTGAYMTGAIPEFAMGLGGAAAPAAGAAGAGAGLGAAFLGPAAIIGLALAMRARSKANFDPTGETRRLNQIENIMQGDGAGIEGLKELVYRDPYVLGLIDQVTGGGVSGGSKPFGTPHTSGGKDLIDWSPRVSALVQANMAELQMVSNAGQRADPANDPDANPPRQPDYSIDMYGGDAP